MRDCKEYREWIQAFTDGFLSRDEEQELKAHVRICAGCTAYLMEMAAYRKAAMELIEDVPAELHERIMDAYYREKHKTNRPAFIRFLRRNPFVATAAVFVLVIGAVFAGGQFSAGSSADTAVYDTQATMAYGYNNVYAGDMKPETTEENTSVTQANGTMDGEQEKLTPSTTAAAATVAATKTAGTEALRKSPVADAVTVLDGIATQETLSVPDVEIDSVYGWALVVKTDGLPSALMTLDVDQNVTTDVDYEGELVTVSRVECDWEQAQAIVKSAPGAGYALYTDEQPWLDQQVDAGLVMLILPNE